MGFYILEEINYIQVTAQLLSTDVRIVEYIGLDIQLHFLEYSSSHLFSLAHLLILMYLEVLFLLQLVISLNSTDLHQLIFDVL